MTLPYYRTATALSLIKGPLINDWVFDQIQILQNRHHRTVDPVGKDQDKHWNEFIAAFDAAFLDSTKAQQAHVALQQLNMRGNDLDSYTATFKHLAKVAGYNLTNLGTVHLFAMGLKAGLRNAILHQDN